MSNSPFKNESRFRLTGWLNICQENECLHSVQVLGFFHVYNHFLNIVTLLPIICQIVVLVFRIVGSRKIYRYWKNLSMLCLHWTSIGNLTWKPIVKLAILLTFFKRLHFTYSIGKKQQDSTFKAKVLVESSSEEEDKENFQRNVQVSKL